MEKVIGYTPEQTTKILKMYHTGALIADLALEFNKSEKSIIAKLVREEVYVSKTKTYTARITKASIIADIAKIIDVQEDTLESLEKATKEALELVLKGLQKK